MAEYKNIIKEFKRYESDGTTKKFILGSEPRFINSILNSGTRNLEEQLLLGNNCKIITKVESDKYIVIKEFINNDIDKNEKHFIIKDTYTLLNTKLLLYIVVDERDGNYIIKTANRAESGAKYSEEVITLADNNVYTLENLGHNNSTNFTICTEELYYGISLKDSSLEKIKTKTITGNINKDSNIFTTTITIS